MSEWPVLGSDAVISANSRYRYALHRTLRDGVDSPQTLLVMMLNPSTATAMRNDNTVTRCIRIARREGYDALRVVNLFAYRATAPSDLRAAHEDGFDVVGPENDQWIMTSLLGSADLLCAWGRTHATQHWVRERKSFVLQMIRASNIPTWRLGRLLQSGSPRHPARVSPTAIPMMRWDDLEP